MKTILFSIVAASVLLAVGLHVPVQADPHHRPSSGVLNGKRILVSGGHGWTWQNNSSFWYTQRAVTNGMVEDFSNAMLVSDFLAPYLINAGADVVTPRERSYQTHELIGDDGDANYSETGTWTQSTNVGGFWGSGYRWATTANTPTATAEWNFNIPQDGQYPVYVRFTAGSDRAADAQYQITHGAGTTNVSLSQKSYSYTNPYDSVSETVSQGGRWVYLGEWGFTQASGARVVLTNESANAGDVVVCDAVRIGAGMGSIDRGGGVTGRPRWEECSRYFAEYQGMPSSVYDVASLDDGSDNVSTPSRMLKWWGDFDLHLALHSNAASGTARGTVTYTYDNSSTPHPPALLADSVSLATQVQSEVMRVNNAWAAAQSDTWNDRGLNTANFGELRSNTKTPSCLLEMAFHDNTQDAWYLRNPRWRHDTGRAIYKAIARYFDTNAVILPLPPTHLRAENTGAGDVRISWRGQNDPAEPTATPTSYRVYLSTDGVSFDDGHAVSTPSYTAQNLIAGTTVFARVTAVNAGGESLWNEVVGARTPSVAAQGLDVPVLIVNGYDRLDEFTWYQQGATHTDGDMHVRNHRNAIVRHAQAFSAASSTSAGAYFFDGASNESVADGDISLAPYPLTDWILGNESTVDETFSTAEQALVSAYLSGGGSLFTSGSEIAWDLDNKGSAGDQAFIANALGGSYVADDSADYTVDAVTGGIFNGQSSFSFDDGSGDAYTVGYPDIIAPTSGFTAALEYSTGNIAAVSSNGVVYLAFPFETITGSAARAALIQNVARHLIPTYDGTNGQGFQTVSGSGSSGDDDGGCTATASTPSPYGFILLALVLIRVLIRRRRLGVR
ncbi:N-acetylmuramoyl-L-alanine amidase [Planctomycetota bacterium]|nr:N-acetylmuramoyl-L-alanine amidase [Planctomycetota bacterium]